MATKKKLLQAAAGAGGAEPGLNVEQVFSTYLYEGNGSEQTINNGIELGDAKGFGGFSFSQSSDYFKISSLIQLIADFTLEAYIYSDSTFTNQNQILGSDLSIDANRQVYIDNSTKYLRMYDGSVLASTSAVPQDQWCHIAITRSGSTITFYIDGVSSGTATSNATFEIRIIGGLVTGAGVNEDFKGKISNLRIVTGSVLYTSDFTPPSTNLTNVSGTQLLTAQGASPQTDNSSNSYTISGFNTPSTYTTANTSGGGEGGLVWIKERAPSTDFHILQDSERGAGKSLFTNNTNAEGGNSGDLIGSFNANGFSVNNDYLGGTNTSTNGSGQETVSWTFRKAPKFFTCVTYSGTGSAQNISHDLGATVGTLIVKRTDSADNWTVWHRGVNSGSGSSFLNLNLTSGYSNSATRWNSTAPTSTQFSVGTHASVNASGGAYVAYLFAHNDGDGDFGPTGDQDIIKCGSYTGNGSTTGPVIDLGFEPQWILVKGASSGAAYDWRIHDVMRGFTADGNGAKLEPNTSDAEDTAECRFKPLPTGFQPTSNAAVVNGSGQTYIYIAIRRGPMAVPTAATDVFDINERLGGYPTPTLINTGNVVDLLIGKRAESSGGGETYFWDRLRGGIKFLKGDSTAAETGTTEYIEFDTNEGFREGFFNTSHNQVHWTWKRAPSFFDVVCYTGTGAAQALTHNLGVAPEFILLKNRSTVVQWTGYHKDLNGGTNPAHYKIVLNETNGEGGSSHWNYTSPTSSDFTVGSSMSASSNNYIAYLFASLDGVSKVGSFTMAGSDINVDCGFSSGARFVLLKRTDSTGNWLVFDSERGIVAGADPYLLLNTTDGEDVFGALDIIDPYSSGFTAVSANIANGNWIFYAIA